MYALLYAFVVLVAAVLVAVAVKVIVIEGIRSLTRGSRPEGPPVLDRGLGGSITATAK
jgi:hypothetical protein